MGKPQNTDEYLANLAEPLREIANRLAKVIDANLPDAHGLLYYGHPWWGHSETPGKQLVTYLKAYKAYVTFGFWRGQAISDSSGRLEAGSGGMGQVKIRSVDEIDEELFGDWLRQAAALERAGK
ncbi:DUF1801 domain-containing protein [Amycolatopsis sp. NPDC101161]|uniref:DUF1801 domain-containing protein n=1 Tax=Amycolatopsis sp. NPDC101161 TaxID=3363940 RepID=UPI0037FE748B